ncbi:hypothetical protein [Demequina sp.]|uniref:hypothetical protein n=1 Tax=Demequina sp. TaxID=2050685 RepID=UPI003D0C7763
MPATVSSDDGAHMWVEAPPARMSRLELLSTREYLGLTHAAFAKVLEVNERTVRSWEGGREPIPERIRAAVGRARAYTDRTVDDLVDMCEHRGERLLVVYRDDGAFSGALPLHAHRGFTARWWRQVSARAQNRLDGATVVSAEEHDALGGDAIEEHAFGAPPRDTVREVHPVELWSRS